MGQQVAVAKAAQMLGISRHDLQRLIRSGELTSYDGNLDLDQLRTRFPSLSLESSAEFERVELIKRSAFSRRVGQRIAPDSAALEIQLSKRNTDLGVQKARANKYHGILQDLFKELEQWCRSDDENQRSFALSLSRWLSERLKD